MSINDIVSTPWAITQDGYNIISKVYNNWVAGVKPNDEFIKSIKSQGNTRKDNFNILKESIPGNVGLVSISGPIIPKATMFSDVSGVVSAEGIQSEIKALRDTDDIDHIVPFIDSPGGSVFGIKETIDLIMEIRNVKNIVAFSDNTMASAAQFISAASNEIVASSDVVMVGNIGVILTLEDRTLSNKELGVKRTNITTGALKDVGSPNKSLSKQDLKFFENLVMEIGGIFFESIAEGRSLTFEQVQERFGDGRPMLAKEGIKLGLIDRVQSFDSLMEDLGNRNAKVLKNGGFKSMAKIETNEVTKDWLARNKSEIVAEIRANAAAEGVEQGKKEGVIIGMAEGAKSECKRIAGIDEVEAFGFNEIVKEAKADGKSTAGDVALKVNAAQQKTKIDYINDRSKELEELNIVPQGSIDAGNKTEAEKYKSKAKSEPTDPMAELKERWKAEPQLEEAFGNFSSWLGELKYLEEHPEEKK